MPHARAALPLLALPFIAACLAPGAARADAIDGSWCLSASERLSIDGPRIVTLAGHALVGAYSRHFFSYTVPEGESPAGATMQMRLLDEQTMQRRAGPDGTVETWTRCSPATS